MLVVKKYPNRRLYDTAESKYITLEDLAARIKGGSDVLVQDATSGADLTQVTLTQIILESRGARRRSRPALRGRREPLPTHRQAHVAHVGTR
jgi:polyhydroxyalkanoate synthesis repressor PhaR